MANSATTEKTDPLAHIRGAMDAAKVAPLWERQAAEPGHEPRAGAAYLWRWAELDPLIDAVAHDVPMENVERRVLTLLNPGLNIPTATTTTNLTGALQILLPGETARPHRHTGNALRLVMEGEGAETIVNGKHCPMVPGDLILTPHWTWHEHAHHGDGRFIWFDSLDVGLIRHFNAAFFEEGPPRNLPPEPADAAFVAVGLMPEGLEDYEGPHSPLFRYSWEAMAQALERAPKREDGAVWLRYVNPLTGGPAMPRLDMGALRLPAKGETTPYRSTAEAICVVVEGAGTTRVGDQEISWGKHDIFALPNWSWIAHKAAQTPTTLFVVSERDMQARLGLLREEARA